MSPLYFRDQLPREAVRELLAIARALYRAECAVPVPDTGRLTRLHEIGHMLRQALELSRGEPNTTWHREAWSWAEKGTGALGEFVASADHLLAPVVQAAAHKLLAG